MSHWLITGRQEEGEAGAGRTPPTSGLGMEDVTSGKVGCRDQRKDADENYFQVQTEENHVKTDISG